MVGRAGFEPAMFTAWVVGLQPTGFIHSPIFPLVDSRGIEPLTNACKALIFPIKLKAHKIKKAVKSLP